MKNGFGRFCPKPFFTYSFLRCLFLEKIYDTGIENERTELVVIVFLKDLVDELCKEICDSSRDRTDDYAAEDIRGVVNHKVIAACAHHENVERADREEPLVLFAEREAKRGHTRHCGGGVA